MFKDVFGVSFFDFEQYFRDILRCVIYAHNKKYKYVECIILKVKRITTHFNDMFKYL